MSLNDQYEELALYLAKAQNDISQVLEHQYATHSASHKQDQANKLSGDERIFRKVKNGVDPKPDNGHKVHFAEAYEEIYIEPDVIIREGRGSPYLQDTLKSNEQSLKSCLKKTMKESQENKNRNGCFMYNSLRNKRPFTGNGNTIQDSNFAAPRITLSGSYPCLASPETNLLYAPDVSMNGNYLSNQNIIPSIRRWSPSPSFFQEDTSTSQQNGSPLYYKENSPTYFQETNSACCQEKRPLCYEDLLYKNSKPITYQETGIQCNTIPNAIYHQDETTTDLQNEADDNLLALIASIKADIQELREKYENDDEIERNRFLTKELDEILQMYKMNISMEKETDLISDIGSTNSYQSVSIFKRCFTSIGKFLSQLCDDDDDDIYMPDLAKQRFYHLQSLRQRRSRSRKHY